MSLVISEVSGYGVIMVGDSAVTRKSNGHTTYHDGCVKVQFSKKARIGFSIWGCANVGAKRMDEWLSEFIENRINDGDGIEDVGERLARDLNSELSTAEYFRRGIHIAGYVGDTPVLYHVHSGHLNEHPHQLQLHRDFPASTVHDQITNGGFVQLRNGQHRQFNVLFAYVHEYTQRLRDILGTVFPPPSLEGRLEYYKMLVRFIAGVLEISQQSRSVNDRLSWVAFDRFGTLREERVPFHCGSGESSASLEC